MHTKTRVRMVLTLSLAALLNLMALSACSAENSTDGPLVQVYKSPSCQCCARWVEHLEVSGFQVEVENQQNMGVIKQRLGVPNGLGSCHTAVVGDYVIEGHVPATDIQRLLREQPDARGLTVPGMPIGSPGMEQGSRQDPYDVLLFTDNDTPPKVYAHHPHAEQQEH